MNENTITWLKYGTVFTIIIIFWGLATASYLYPSHLVDEEQQLRAEDIIADGCPHLRSLYDRILNEDGRIHIDDMTDIIYMCTEEMRKELFYQTLVEEFSRHYK